MRPLYVLLALAVLALVAPAEVDQQVRCNEGGEFAIGFVVEYSTGDAAVADTTPEVVLKVLAGGVIAATAACDVVADSTGEYLATGTVPATAVSGQILEAWRTYVLDGITHKALIYRKRLGT